MIRNNYRQLIRRANIHEGGGVGVATESIYPGSVPVMVKVELKTEWAGFTPNQVVYWTQCFCVPVRTDPRRFK